MIRVQTPILPSIAPRFFTPTWHDYFVTPRHTGQISIFHKYSGDLEFFRLQKNFFSHPIICHRSRGGEILLINFGAILGWGSLTCTPGIGYYPVPPFFLNMIGSKLFYQPQNFIVFCATFILEKFIRFFRALKIIKNIGFFIRKIDISTFLNTKKIFRHYITYISIKKYFFYL